LDQPFIREPGKSVEELIRETIGLLGENITVRRFGPIRARREPLIRVIKWGREHDRVLSFP